MSETPRETAIRVASEHHYALHHPGGWLTCGRQVCLANRALVPDRSAAPAPPPPAAVLAAALLLSLLALAVGAALAAALGWL